MWFVCLLLLGGNTPRIALLYFIDSTAHTDGLSSIVSQFTLLAQTKKGSKPDFHGAAGGDKARELYNHFVDKVKEIYQPEKVKDGVFQAMMQVELVNDGPVGVDYRCDDGEVNLKPLHHPNFPAPG